MRKRNEQKERKNSQGVSQSVHFRKHCAENEMGKTESMHR